MRKHTEKKVESTLFKSIELALAWRSMPKVLQIDKSAITPESV